MRDDELLAIYGATRQLAEGMQARDAELKQSTAALEATIAQVRQLPAMLGQQTSKYIAAGIREVVQEDFKQPWRKRSKGRSGPSMWRPTMRGRRLGTSRRGPLPDLDRLRPYPGSGFCSGSLRNVLLLYPAGVGIEQPFRPL